MTVKELIDLLNKIEDKNMNVMIHEEQLILETEMTTNFRVITNENNRHSTSKMVCLIPD